ncbi:fungal-specific transcription factor domain-containing protein [Dactylonectria estremocensis]|uniref:Fungal-specific transcription factor domain-containing protein n=1 Tax=Dactylonectria estremocensis TaxID=1079267 RepID=A0A9P9DN34_9HYPO|nr:fungal-specific transcription factor domain-containing protein [Dactylonectria estremocensis]
MSHVPGVLSSGAGGGSAAAPEGNSASSVSTPASASASTKLRSCVVCRSRKVRCDKLSPCSNCRRANIACVVPSNDRPPRWARRLERITKDAAASTARTPHGADPGAVQVMERLRNLESLVKELSGQLEQANAAVTSAHEREANRQMNTPSPDAGVMQQHFGRLVLQDTSQSHYIGSGFWSRVSDELDGLKIDTRRLADDDSDTSEDEDSPGKSSVTHELERSPSERHSFLFGHNLAAAAPDLREFRPLPSQIPFLLNIFSENVNLLFQIVHIPYVTQLTRGMRGVDLSSLTPANEALVFSISYAAVTSMEEDDVMDNFGASKAELNFKYRLGLEHALAKADFLNSPDIVLVQAFTIFLSLARRHDSPKFVWMMTGLVIRMALAIGLHRDGSHFKNLSPYEVQMRRRVWWSLCMLDIRASEDQGTDYTIASGSFDTKLPLNIDDSNLGPNTREMPAEHQGVTCMSIALVSFEMCETIRQMMAPGAKPTLEEQSRLLNSLYAKLENGYLQYSAETWSVASLVMITCTRLVIAKLRLLIYLPVLFSPPSEHFSDDLRNQLLVAALEVAEYNHALNAERDHRHWRWIYQTYTHWYAIVFLLIEVSRRPWSPIVERAWVALHSSWLIPAQPNAAKNLRTWVPLRKLMSKARKHRKTELERLRGDALAINQLEESDRNIPVPASSGPFPMGKGEELFLQHWRSLVSKPARSDGPKQLTGPPGIVDSTMSIPAEQVDAPRHDSARDHAGLHTEMWSNITIEPVDLVSGSQSGGSRPPDTFSHPKQVGEMSSAFSGPADASSHSTPSTVPTDSSDGQMIGPGFTPWLWADNDPTVDVFADVDVNMDMDENVDWNNWLEIATGVEENMRAEEAEVMNA